MDKKLVKLANGNVVYQNLDGSEPRSFTSDRDVNVGGGESGYIMLRKGSDMFEFLASDVKELISDSGTIDATNLTIDEFILELATNFFLKATGGNGNPNGGDKTTDASELTSGTLPDDRLSDNIPRKDEFKTLNGENIIGNGNIEILTNEPTTNADDLTSGTLSNERLSDDVLLKTEIQGSDRQVLGYDSDGNPTPLKLGWKQLSDLPSTPPFSNGVLAGTAFQPDGSALFAFLELALGTPKTDTIPTYNTGGTLSVENGINPKDAVNVSQLSTIMSNKVDEVEGKSLSDNNYTLAEKTKLSTLENFDPTNILISLDKKVDEVDGMGLSATSFTQAEKSKLAAIVDHYAGRFTSLTDLNTVVGSAGSYAYVSINSAPTVVYAWNAQTTTWDSTALAASEESPESIKAKYETNPDTNAFSDADKAKLNGISVEATKNSTDAYLLSLVNQTGSLPLSKVTDLILIINNINAANDAQTEAISSHNANTSNPHGTTKTQVGLGNVDNTSDANKPISTATANALSNKEPANTNIQQHIGSTGNPHGTTKTQVGLGNVDNTSDANKPISTATANALLTKQKTLVSGTDIKTFNGVSLLGQGNINGNAYINTSTTNGVTTTEYFDRFEYKCKIPYSRTVIKNNYSSITSTNILPVGVTIDGSDEHYISIKNNSRTIGIAVYDTTSRNIIIGFHNYWSEDVTVSGSVFIKLIKYK